MLRERNTFNTLIDWKSFMFIILRFFHLVCTRYESHMLREKHRIAIPLHARHDSVDLWVLTTYLQPFDVSKRSFKDFKKKFKYFNIFEPFSVQQCVEYYFRCSGYHHHHLFCHICHNVSTFFTRLECRTKLFILLF